MKTFRLMRLSLFEKDGDVIEMHEIKMKEGLIINREEPDKSWLLDAVIPTEYEDIIHEWEKHEEEMLMEAVITHPDNAPALLRGIVKKTTRLEHSLGVLIQAYIAGKDENITELILQELITEGYEGDQLLEEFHERKNDQRSWSKAMAARLYSRQEK